MQTSGKEEKNNIRRQLGLVNASTSPIPERSHDEAAAN